MSRRLRDQINNLLLIRLVELIRDSKFTLESSLSDKAKVNLVLSDFNDVFKLVGSDISEFIEGNMFCLRQVRDAKLPKQFIKFRNEVNGPSFQICLN